MDRLAQIFNGLNLPVPGAGEFYFSHNNVSFLIPLTDAGCLIRITKAGNRLTLRSPNILRPLLHRNLNRHCFLEIYPGVDLIVAAGDNYGKPLFHDSSEQLAKAGAGCLKAQGIGVNDAHPANFGIIPGTDQIVFIDPNPEKIRRVRDHQLPANRIFTREENGAVVETSEDFQVPFYHELQGCLDEIWPEGSAAPLGKKSSRFWDLSAAMSRNGKLVSAWTLSNYFGTAHCAANYKLSVEAWRAGAWTRGGIEHAEPAQSEDEWYRCDQLRVVFDAAQLSLLFQ